MDEYRPTASLPGNTDDERAPQRAPSWWNYVPMKTYKLSTSVTSIVGNPLNPFDVVLVSGIRISRMKLSKKWVTEPTEVIPSLSNERRATFRDDGKVLVSCGASGIHAWNVLNGKSIRTWEKRSSGGVTNCICVGNQDSKVYSTTSDGHILEHDLISETTQRRLRAHKGEISSVSKLNIEWKIQKKLMEKYIKVYSENKKSTDNEQMESNNENISVQEQIIEENVKEFEDCLKANKVRRIQATLLVTGGYDRMVKIWDVGKGTNSINYNSTNSLIKEIDFGCEIETLDVWNECDFEDSEKLLGSSPSTSSYIVVGGGSVIKIYKLKLSYGDVKNLKQDKNTKIEDISLMPEFELDLISSTEVPCKGITCLSLAVNPSYAQGNGNDLPLPFVIVFGAFDGRVRIAFPLPVEKQKKLDLDENALQNKKIAGVDYSLDKENHDEDMSGEMTDSIKNLSSNMIPKSSEIKLHVHVMSDLKSTVISIWLCCEKYKVQNVQKKKNESGKAKNNKNNSLIKCFKVAVGTANSSVTVLDTKDNRMKMNGIVNLKADLLGIRPGGERRLFGISDEDMKQEKLRPSQGVVTNVSEKSISKKKLKMIDIVGTNISIEEKIDPETKQLYQITVNKEIVLGKVNPSENDVHYVLTKPSNEILKNPKLRKNRENHMNALISRLMKGHFDTSTLEIAIETIYTSSKKESDNSKGIDLVAILREMEYSDPYLFRKALDSISFDTRLKLTKLLISIATKQESDAALRRTNYNDKSSSAKFYMKNANANSSFCLRILTYLLYVMDIARIDPRKEKTLKPYIKFVEEVTRTMHKTTKLAGMVDSYLSMME